MSGGLSSEARPVTQDQLFASPEAIPLIHAVSLPGRLGSPVRPSHPGSRTPQKETHTR